MISTPEQWSHSPSPSSSAYSPLTKKAKPRSPLPSSSTIFSVPPVVSSAAQSEPASPIEEPARTSIAIPASRSSAPAPIVILDAMCTPEPDPNRTLINGGDVQNPPAHPMKTERQVRLASTSLNSVMSTVVIEKPASSIRRLALG